MQDYGNSSTEKLETLLAENRWTVALFFPAVGALGIYASRIYDHPLLDFMSGSVLLLVGANLVMSLPLITCLLPVIDRESLAGIIVLGLFSYAVETVGVVVGLPYGEFGYESQLGPFLFGVVPLALPLLWVPILLNGFLLATVYVYPRTGSVLSTAVFGAGFVVALDFILDPGAVAVGFWEWEDPGVYYGVPAINYLGWLVSSAVGVGIIGATIDLDRLHQRVTSFAPTFDTLITFLVFWGIINLAYFQVLPLALSLLLGVVLASTQKWRYFPD